ncbi:synovial sarcoma translocation protein on chromosome 18-like [Datura stramonium]|uniref:Synovial sarcoma translocation protein on chromosome 18-like n=1 Tax=Datura stramonium TaxID=4076 RepID=A0ABS8VAQ2_DATST|nr:synovial sarcoma translocation protein on chromosome 18-like [Datura stramonium]
MQQQQAQPPVLNSAPPLPLSAITTEQIQKFLDENKNLILAILENQNLGKLSECAQYQAMLQKNLMYLAAIADAQPQQSAATSQAPSTPQHGNQMQQTQAALQQQQGASISKLPFQLNALPSQEQQQQMLQFQQQQQFQGQYGFGPTANNAMRQLMQPGLSGSGTLDVRGNKQGSLEGNPSDGHGKSAGRHVNGERE